MGPPILQAGCSITAALQDLSQYCLKQLRTFSQFWPHSQPTSSLTAITQYLGTMRSQWLQL